jgi:hypothetical protein
MPPKIDNYDCRMKRSFVRSVNIDLANMLHRARMAAIQKAVARHEVNHSESAIGRERQRVAGQKPIRQRHWANECKAIVSSAVEIRLHSEAKALQMWSKMWSNYPEHAPQISL